MNSASSSTDGSTCSAAPDPPEPTPRQRPAQAIESLVLLHEGVVDAQIVSLHVPNECRDDARQAGLLAVVLAARNSKQSSNVSFGVIAARRARDAVIDEAFGKGRRSDVPNLVPLREDLTVSDCELELVDTRLAVAGFVKTLTPLQQAVTHAVFWEGKTQSEVARERGMSRAACNQILARVYAAGRIALSDLDPGAKAVSRAA